MPYKTREGRRPDLEQLKVNQPEGYIGNLIYPVYNTHEKAGKIYYKTVTADSAVQTGRSLGTAPTRTLLADSNADYTCVEAIKRYGVDLSEVKQMGGIEAADKLGGEASKRSVLRGHENLAAAKLFSAARYAAGPDISAAIFDGIDTAAALVKRYAGKLACVLPHSVYKFLVKQTEITAKLGFSINSTPGFNTADLMSINKNVFKSMLQAMFAFDEVLIGDDDHWEIVTQEDMMVICKLPPPDRFSHKMDPVLGKNMLYLPDGIQPFEIESFYDKVDRVNTYDCVAWNLINELNASAAVAVTGLGTPTT